MLGVWVRVVLNKFHGGLSTVIMLNVVKKIRLAQINLPYS